MSTEAEKRAKRKYYLLQRESDESYYQERRDNYNPKEWKTHPIHTDYELSIYGDVYYKGGMGKRNRRRSKVLKQHTNKLGYKTVAIDNVRMYVHILMGQTFLQNPENKPEIDHIDGNPSNNAVSNLRWATHKENLNNPVCVDREIKSHTGKQSNILGRKKMWVDKSRKIYKMV